MSRAGAQFVFVRAGEVVRNGVVERDEQGIITNLFSLNDRRAESAHTVFHNGILIALPLSVSAQDFCRRLYAAQVQSPEATVFELLAEADLPPLSAGSRAQLALVEHLDWETGRVSEQTQIVLV